MLSDNQRRFLCRIVFLVGCVVPTLSVIYWIFHRPTPADWARMIKAELGVDAAIDSIETPWPGITILRGVKLTDFETGKLFEATEVGIELTETENRIIVNQNLSLTNTGLIKLLQFVNENPIRRHVADRPWHIYLNGLTTIHDRSKSLQFDQPPIQTITFEQTQVELKPYQNGTELYFRFQLVDAPQVLEPGYVLPPRPIVEASLGRSHPDSDGASDLLAKLNTKGVSLPCWLLGDLIPELRDLGGEARFEGRLEIEPSYARARGWVQGRFSQIDRASLGRYGSFESIELFCELNGGVTKWVADLVDSSRGRTPIPFQYPFRVNHAIIAAQQDYNNTAATTYR